ncbi:MAG: intradiol ring-cleavage dioxygenase [Allomuricauda sp.]
MKPTTTLCISALLFSLNACSQSTKKQKPDLETSILNQDKPSWGGTFEAPTNVSWSTIIPPKGEPGEKLIISGTVFLPDGRTPAKDVIVYVYHTNNEGIYPKKGNEEGNGKYHGYLRGWMKTNANGFYEFETIRPAPYQSHDGEPAHIHYTIEAPDYPEYWLTGLWFLDDPRVTAYKDKIERDGGFSNITSLSINENNILTGTRNIILQKFED